jgi:hypothetical protein
MRLAWILVVLCLAAGCDNNLPSWECRRYLTCQAQRGVPRTPYSDPMPFVCRVDGDTSYQCAAACRQDRIQNQCPECIYDADCDGHPAGHHCFLSTCRP